MDGGAEKSPPPKSTDCSSVRIEQGGKLRFPPPCTGGFRVAQGGGFSQSQRVNFPGATPPWRHGLTVLSIF
jgi:hypothetical protein